MTKWVRHETSKWGLSSALVFFDRICFYVGKTDHWGVGFDINFYDRSFTIELLNWYTGIELWRKNG